MKLRLNSVLLGAFIVGAFALAVAVFLALGTHSIFGHAARFTIYLTDSAEGIREGLAVDMQGVRIGQVDKVQVICDANTRRAMVSVLCRITENKVSDPEGHLIKLTDRSVMDDLISKGLCAQVETAGIVGAKFVQLNFHSPAPALPPGLPPSKTPVVPVAPSSMAEMKDKVSSILAHLSKTDFPGMADEAKDALASVRQQLDELQTNHMTDHFSAAASSAAQFIKSEELRRALTRIEGAAADLQQLTTNIDARVPALATNLNGTMEAAGQTVGSLRDFLALRSQLGDQTRQLLEQLDQTAQAIQQLADFLDRHPNALISGRTREGHFTDQP